MSQITQLTRNNYTSDDSDSETGCLYQISNGPLRKPIDFVFMLDETKEESCLDVQFNKDKLCFDMAVSELQVETLNVSDK